MHAQPHTGPRGSQKAFKKGAQAARDGKPMSSCPYPDAISARPNDLNMGSRWRSHWVRGFNSVKGKKP